MKYCGLLLFLFLSSIAIGQPLIHAHNDYQQAAPLTNALRYKVFSIEADVYLYNNKLVVAHDKKELPMAPTLDSLYLQPIVALFAKHLPLSLLVRVNLLLKPAPCLYQIQKR